MRKNLKRKVLLTMLLALLAFPQIVKADMLEIMLEKKQVLEQ